MVGKWIAETAESLEFPVPRLRGDRETQRYDYDISSAFSSLELAWWNVDITDFNLRHKEKPARVLEAGDGASFERTDFTWNNPIAAGRCSWCQ